MPVNLIQIEDENQKDVPWLTEHPKQKKFEGTTFVVQKLVLRPKGLLVLTSEFKVFIWKSSKAHNQILEHVGKGTNPENPVDSVVIVPVIETRYQYCVGFDDDVKGCWDEEGLNLTFRELLTVPSKTASLDLQGSGMVDSSPKNGRRAS